jgi:hypothetical protein
MSDWHYLQSQSSVLSLTPSMRSKKGIGHDYAKDEN